MASVNGFDFGVKHALGRGYILQCLLKYFIFIFQLLTSTFMRSRFSGNIFPEEKTNQRSTVHELPEESNREVHESGLEPYSNELGTCIFKQNCSNQAHDRAHDADDHNGNRKCDNDRSVL